MIIKGGCEVLQQKRGGGKERAMGVSIIKVYYAYV
jgi:hypothetical protein